MRLRIVVRARQDADGAAGVRRFAFTENSVGTDVVMVDMTLAGAGHGGWRGPQVRTPGAAQQAVECNNLIKRPGTWAMCSTAPCGYVYCSDLRQLGLDPVGQANSAAFIPGMDAAKQFHYTDQR